jgi:hypothetical protein
MIAFGSLFQSSVQLLFVLNFAFTMPPKLRVEVPTWRISIPISSYSAMVWLTLLPLLLITALFTINKLWLDGRRSQNRKVLLLRLLRLLDRH